MLYSAIVLTYVLFFLLLFFSIFLLVRVFPCRIMRLFGILILSGSFLVIERWGGSFGGVQVGYPLLHPVLPFLSFYRFQFKKETGCPQFISLRPRSLSIESLYHSIEVALCAKSSNQDARFFVTPESALAEDLILCDNKMFHLINLLGEHDFLCIGGLKKNNDEVGHATYVYNNKGLIDCFEKELLVPFYEYIPDQFKKYQWARNLFLANKNSFVHGKREKKETPFDCFICADFFLKPLKRSNRSNLFFIMMNERCLPEFVVDLLLVYAEWKCFKEGATGFCVGWNNSLKIF